MNRINELHSFIHENGLELYITKKRDTTRILVVYPDGTYLSGNSEPSNMEVYEKQDTDFDKCINEAAEQVPRRYAEILEFKKARGRR